GLNNLASTTADVVHIPGTKVSLEPPKGFVRAARFTGFQQTDLQASIMVTEIPGPMAEVAKGTSKAVLATRGMSLISEQTEKIGGREARVVKVSQKAAGIEFLKWMLLMGD